MDFSEKDAARSKWKLTQRHKRGRGARGSPSARGGRHQAQARDLGSNEDRYLEPEVDELAGPVRKAQGADLAGLLEGAEVYDAGYYHRSRANLLEEYGLPPGDALSYQGLSFDLKGLAACLSLLPRGELLRTDAFEDEKEEGEREGEDAGRPLAEGALPVVATATAGEAQHPKQPQPQLPPSAGATAAVIAPLPARSQSEVSLLHPTSSSEHVEHSQPGRPRNAPQMGQAEPPAEAAAGVDLHGGQAAGPVPPLQQQPQQQSQRAMLAAAAPGLRAAAGAAGVKGTPPPSSPPPPSQQQQPPQLRQQQAAGDYHDDDLDFLLGLVDVSTPQPLPQQQPMHPGGQLVQGLQQGHGQGQGLPLPPTQAFVQHAPQQSAAPGALAAGGGGVTRVGAPAPKEQSLDDWLDTL